MKRISIGIPAYNEQSNISGLIRSLLAQKKDKYKLEEIIVISDGSTDNTCALVKNFKDKKIKLINHKQRKGKAIRVNELFHKFNGDLLILCDADVLPENNLVLDKLVSKALANEDLKLVIAKTVPLIGTTFFERSVNNFFRSREMIKGFYHYGNSVYGARAGAMVLKRNFAKNLRLPKNILNDDAYLYLVCKRLGYKSFFHDKAIIYYRSATTIPEYIGQFKRYLVGEKQMHEYFPEDFINREYSVPASILLRIMFGQLKRNFVGYIILRSINFYCIYKAKFSSLPYQSTWRIITSSKKLIT